ncbi:hypothetical protein D3C81_1461930 [compost metagenome]
MLEVYEDKLGLLQKQQQRLGELENLRRLLEDSNLTDVHKETALGMVRNMQEW